MGGRRPRIENLQDLLDRSTPEPNSGCILWAGHTLPNGYGNYTNQHLPENYVHRLAYYFVNGEIPAGLVVMHLCDQRSCVNPLHLRAGTQKENLDDMVAKGRQVVRPGEDCHFHKLKTEDVLKIKIMLGEKSLLQREIAEIFGVSDSAINAINVGAQWKHLTSA